MMNNLFLRRSLPANKPCSSRNLGDQVASLQQEEDLIVNFPSRPRRTQSAPQLKRMVTFKETADLILLPSHPKFHDAPKKAYSKADIDQFKANLLVDVRRLREDLASDGTPDGVPSTLSSSAAGSASSSSGRVEASNVSDDRVYNCVGLERYLSQNVLRRSLLHRRTHSSTIIAASRAQQQQQAAEAEDSEGSLSGSIQLDGWTFAHEGSACNEEKLACVARDSSRWARERAEKLAVAYSQF